VPTTQDNSREAADVDVAMRQAEALLKTGALQSAIFNSASARDAELILDALEPHRLACEIVHARDGAEILNYLHRRAEFAGRSDGQRTLTLLGVNEVPESVGTGERGD
jgi:hypothetical protein